MSTCSWAWITLPRHNLCDKSQSTAEECIITPIPLMDRQTHWHLIRTRICIQGRSHPSTPITPINRCNLENTVASRWRLSTSLFLSKSIKQLSNMTSFLHVKKLSKKALFLSAVRPAMPRTSASEPVRTVPMSCSSSCLRDKRAREKRQQRRQGGGQAEINSDCHTKSDTVSTDWGVLRSLTKLKPSLTSSLGSNTRESFSKKWLSLCCLVC